MNNDKGSEKTETEVEYMKRLNNLINTNQMTIHDYLYKLHCTVPVHPNHINYLKKMKDDFIDEPKIIYDIGSCVIHWTHIAETVWTDAEYILFDAFREVEPLYKNNKYKYHIGLLGDEQDKEVTWYQNHLLPGGNSMYREKNDIVFPPSHFTMRRMETLANVVAKHNFPLPDIIKIDVQGCEKNILLGGKDIIKHAKHLIIEMQHTEYNEGAPLNTEVIPVIEEMGFRLVTPLFCNNGPDGDYHFENISLSKN
jgi:FkbM family methyltransferase